MQQEEEASLQRDEPKASHDDVAFLDEQEEDT